jgi:hypothetical protein
MTCPDCERFKESASLWRNEAYRLGGTPLPWSPDEALLRKALDALQDIGDEWGFTSDRTLPKRRAVVAALEERLKDKT